MKKIFNNFGGAKIFISEKEDGNMKLFSSGFGARRKQYLDKRNFKYDNLVSAKLDHGSSVRIVKDSSEKFINKTDGLLTNDPEIVLSITVADCFPVFLFDPIQGVVGVLHCGWRSVFGGIIEEALTKMSKEFECESKNILIKIGPGIQDCHFEVEHNFIEKFSRHQELISEKKSRKYFDLQGLINKKIISCGIKKSNIEEDNRCTFCEKDLWSFRRDGELNGEIRAMMAGIQFNTIFK